MKKYEGLGVAHMKGNDSCFDKRVKEGINKIWELGNKPMLIVMNAITRHLLQENKMLDMKNDELVILNIGNTKHCSYLGLPIVRDNNLDGDKNTALYDFEIYY